MERNNGVTVATILILMEIVFKNIPNGFADVR
jgi:hypothetical protein